MNIYDCIIIGAGPAGLGCGLNLSQKGARVLILEKNPLGETFHSWIIWNDFLEQQDLTEAIRRPINCLTFSSFLGSTYRLTEPISASVHEEHLLTLLADKIKKNNGTIKDHEPCYSYRHTNDTVIVKTAKSEYTGRFLVDASGESSRISMGLGYHNRHALGMGCYGYDITGADFSNHNETLIFDAFFPGKDYFWLIPYTENSGFVGVFFFDEIGRLSFEKPVHILKKYLSAKKITGTIKKTRQGIIPLSPKPFVQKNNVLFIGDAASSPLPSSGFGFVKSFEEGALCARHIYNILSDKPSPKQFEQEIYETRYPGYETHYLISNILINLTDQLLHKAISNMNNISSDYMVHFLKGDDLSLKFVLQSFLHIRSTYTIQEIRDMAIGQNYKEIMLRLFSVYPKITIPIIKRELKTLFKEIAQKLPKEFR